MDNIHYLNPKTGQSEPTNNIPNNNFMLNEPINFKKWANIFLEILAFEAITFAMT